MPRLRYARCIVGLTTAVRARVLGSGPAGSAHGVTMQHGMLRRAGQRRAHLQLGLAAAGLPDLRIDPPLHFLAPCAEPLRQHTRIESFKVAADFHTAHVPRGSSDSSRQVVHVCLQPGKHTS